MNTNSNSGATSMQLYLNIPNHVLIKYDINVYAGLLLNYYSNASWKMNKMLLGNDLFICAEYDFDVSIKNPGLRISKRTFVNCIKELFDKGVIAKHFDKKKLYVHVFDHVIYDINNAKIIIDENPPADSYTPNEETATTSKKSSIYSSDFNEFYEEVKRVYPKKVFSEKAKMKLKKSNLLNHAKDFIQAIINLSKTQKVSNGFSPKLTTFMDEWESYKNGVPEGEKLIDGTVSVGEKIANGAAEPKTPMMEFYNKCTNLMHTMHNDGTSWRFDLDKEELNHGFGDKELKAIYDLGGFAVVMKTCADSGEFIPKIIEIWAEE